MDVSLSSIMLVFFVLALGLSAWKIYYFLPNKPLLDDDNTPEAKEKLLHIMMDVLAKQDNAVTIDELYVLMIEDAGFDREHFWRFNLNKLRNLLQHYYIKNPDTQSIEDIYKKLKN